MVDLVSTFRCIVLSQARMRAARTTDTKHIKLTSLGMRDSFLLRDYDAEGLQVRTVVPR